MLYNYLDSCFKQLLYAGRCTVEYPLLLPRQPRWSMSCALLAFMPPDHHAIEGPPALRLRFVAAFDLHLIIKVDHDKQNFSESFHFWMYCLNVFEQDDSFNPNGHVKFNVKPSHWLRMYDTISELKQGRPDTSPYRVLCSPQIAASFDFRARHEVPLYHP